MKKTENCLHCEKEYTPTRKGVQIFCSNSCRSRYWYLNNSLDSKSTPLSKDNKEVATISKEEIKIDKMSRSGVGNATVGTLVGNLGTDLLKNVFTKDENKPATKGDIEALKNLINTRYFLIHNVKTDVWGRKPYFDIGTGKILYHDEKANVFYLPEFELG